jgi:hypothetical protein
MLVTGGVVVVGTVLSDDDGTQDEGGDDFRTTALEDFETSGLVVRRASFCGAIDPRQVKAALGADSEAERSWDNGDRIEVTDGVRDVVHEFGCEYVAGAVTARAWVFAPQIDARRARQLAKAKGPGGLCTGPVARAAPYGEPSSLLSCLSEGTYLTSYQGLFGDAWLTCELSVTAPAAGEQPEIAHLVDRTGRWCVGVALAASSEETADG